jgi:SAM-dependent methyltransferase
VRAGRDVVAVEPLVEMLAQLRLALPGVRAAAGTAEAVPARSDAFAGITVGQAFHWFDPADALAEAGRVLRPGGVLALLFNVRDESVGWVRAVTDLIELRSGGRPYSDHRERSWQSVVGEHGSFVPLCDRDFDNPVPSSPRGVLERVRSTSFVAVMEPGAREDLLREVAGVLETDPGTAGRDRFDYPHRTVVHLWTLGG